MRKVCSAVSSCIIANQKVARKPKITTSLLLAHSGPSKKVKATSPSKSQQRTMDQVKDVVELPQRFIKEGTQVSPFCCLQAGKIARKPDIVLHFCSL
jgi:hypothetical protein